MNKQNVKDLMRAAIELSKYKLDDISDYSVVEHLSELVTLSTRHQTLTLTGLNVPHNQEQAVSLNNRRDRIENKATKIIFQHYRDVTVSFHYCGGRGIALNFPSEMHNSWGGDWVL